MTLSLGNEAARIIRSHEQGTFLFAGLPATAGTLNVSAKGYKAVTRDVTPSADPQPLEIELEPTEEPQLNPKRAGDSALSLARDEANMG